MQIYTYINKIQMLVDKIPTFVFSLLILYFIGMVFSHADNSVLVVSNSLGAVCFTYLAIHKLI